LFSRKQRKKENYFPDGGRAHRERHFERKRCGNTRRGASGTNVKEGEGAGSGTIKESDSHASFPRQSALATMCTRGNPEKAIVSSCRNARNNGQRNRAAGQACDCRARVGYCPFTISGEGPVETQGLLSLSRLIELTRAEALSVAKECQLSPAERIRDDARITLLALLSSTRASLD